MGKRFYLADALPKDIGTFDLAMSLEYMSRLFSHSRRYVVIYSSDHEARTHANHVRH
jgi:hypothetical protein